MMRQRIISICIIGILLCGIYKYAQIAEAPTAKPVIAIEYTDERVRISAPAETKGEILSSSEPVQPEAVKGQWQVYIQPDMPEPFIEVLKQYEDFMNADVQDINDENVRAKLGDEWWYLYDELCMHGTEIRYSLTDLTDDGFPELIMGFYVDYTGIYDDYFDKVYPKVVYYISPTEGIKMEFTSSYFTMDFYEGGIIEHISAGVNYTITYRRFREETESWELADRIIVDWNSQDDSESCYWGVNTADFSDPDNKPMSEEEYREIVEQYTAEPVELEWIPLFVSEASDGKEESKNNEPITVIAKGTKYYSDGSITHRDKYEYDSAGKLMKDIRYTNNASFYWYKYKYDSAGNKAKTIRYNTDSSIREWEEYEYITFTPQ